MIDINKMERNENKYEWPMIYAMAKNGNVRTYKIEVEDRGDSAVLTTSKTTKLGGKVTQDTYTFTEGVNIGKANETTYLQQAINEAESRFKKQQDKGFKEEMPTGDTNTDASGNIKPMLACGWSDKKVKYPCLVQPKYDGVRCIVDEKNGEILIYSRQGKPYNIPHLKEWASQHRDLLPLDGELYNHGDLTFQEIVSAVKKESEITSKIRYAVYDRPMEGDNLERQAFLGANLNLDGDPVYRSPVYTATNYDELVKLHNLFVEDGYEGAIIRNFGGKYEAGFRSNDLIKLKMFKDAEFEIVDVVEATGRDAGTAIFVCDSPNGQFKAKPEGSRELRKEYFEKKEELIGKILTVRYQELTNDGVPRFPIGVTIRDYE